MPRIASVFLSGAALAAVAACESDYGYYDDARRAWEVNAWATARPDGLYSVRTVTVAPDSCYAPGEIRSAPSTLPETIELQANVIRSTGPCDRGFTDIVHDLPAVRLEPDDRQIEVVVYAEGAERNRVRVNLAELPPIAGPYDPRYDPRDPRYDPRDPRYLPSRYSSLTLPERAYLNRPRRFGLFALLQRPHGQVNTRSWLNAVSVIECLA